MSRVVKSSGNISLAFGVDFGLEPGTARSFVQIWNNAEEKQPCNEGEEGFNNILVNEWDISQERVLELARQYQIPLTEQEVFKVLD